jgi:hypothetical protein
MARGQGAGWGGKLVAALGLVCIVAGCAASEPYLFKRKEFDRDSPAFNQPRPEGDLVLICYNGWWTSEAALLAMAETECARHGTSAIPRAVDERFGPCPLLVPMQAMFQCEGETKAPTETRKKDKKKKAKTPQTPADAGAEAVPADAASAPASDGSDGLETAPAPEAQIFDAGPETREDETLTDAPL